MQVIESKIFRHEVTYGISALKIHNCVGNLLSSLPISNNLQIDNVLIFYEGPYLNSQYNHLNPVQTTGATTNLLLFSIC